MATKGVNLGALKVKCKAQIDFGLFDIRYSPSNCPLLKFHWEIRSSSRDIAQYVFQQFFDGGSRIFSFWPWEKACLCREIFLQSTILTVTQVLGWTFSRASSSRSVASVTSHRIQSEPLHQCESKVRHIAFRSILWSTKLYILGTRANFSVKLWQWTMEGEYF